MLGIGLRFSIPWANQGQPRHWISVLMAIYANSCLPKLNTCMGTLHFRKRPSNGCCLGLQVSISMTMAHIQTSELCFFLLSGSVYSCAAYTTVYAMPTRPQWEPTRLIPLKVCLRRPNARIKRRHNVCFAYAVTLLFGFGRLETEFLPTRPKSHLYFCSTSAQAPKRP